MPDRRKHRGAHPEDEQLFGASQHPRLRGAVHDYSWLLSYGYAEPSALALVGNRFELTTRQRLAVRRASCSDEQRASRAARRVDAPQIAGRTVLVDGYNLLITVESALAGGVIFVGRDGCCRDLASIHGTYRQVEETEPAVELTVGFLAARRPNRVRWLLDRPVSNSGRLKALMERVLARQTDAAQRPVAWSIELADSPDAVLRQASDPVITSDSAILDQCGVWFNAAAEVLATHVPGAWMVDLRTAVEQWRPERPAD